MPSGCDVTVKKTLEKTREKWDLKIESEINILFNNRFSPPLSG